MNYSLIKLNQQVHRSWYSAQTCLLSIQSTAVFLVKDYTYFFSSGYDINQITVIVCKIVKLKRLFDGNNYPSNWITKWMVFTLTEDLIMKHRLIGNIM